METIRCVVDHFLVFLDESKNSVRSWVEPKGGVVSATCEFPGFAVSGSLSSSDVLRCPDAGKQSATRGYREFWARQVRNKEEDFLQQAGVLDDGLESTACLRSVK
jgi:hypothetical protein